MDGLKSFTTIPFDVDGAFRNRLGIIEIKSSIDVINETIVALNALNGILEGDGLGGFSATEPLSGTKVYYVSDSSGGLVTRKLTFINGILTSET